MTDKVKKFDITVRVRVTTPAEEDRYKNKTLAVTEETAAISILADSAEEALTKLQTIIPAL